MTLRGKILIVGEDEKWGKTTFSPKKGGKGKVR